MEIRLIADTTLEAVRLKVIEYQEKCKVDSTKEAGDVDDVDDSGAAPSSGGGTTTGGSSGKKLPSDFVAGWWNAFKILGPWGSAVYGYKMDQIYNPETTNRNGPSGMKTTSDNLKENISRREVKMNKKQRGE